MKTKQQKSVDYKVFSICYDLDYNVDENELELPRHLTINTPIEVSDNPIELEAFLADKISDESGFLVFSFEYKQQGVKN